MYRTRFTSMAYYSIIVLLITTQWMFTAQHVDAIESVTLPPLWHYNITNGTQHIVDDHIYYKAEYGAAPAEDAEVIDAAHMLRFHKYYVTMNRTQSTRVHDLAGSHGEAVEMVPSSGGITFYGQHIDRITVSTGGFIYMGAAGHQWIGMTQYIAPLMANFHTRQDNDLSDVLYMEDDDGITVEWRDVYGKDKEQLGSFTFQCQLKRDGTIIFIYVKLPVDVNELVDASHPVKVGLSDAYIIERQSTFFKRKTIYEYHNVNIPISRLHNYTVIRLLPKPTCHTFATSCRQCISAADVIPDFQFTCSWCPALQDNPCSNGVDRRRQQWKEHCTGTTSAVIGNPNECPAEPTTSSSSTAATTTTSATTTRPTKTMTTTARARTTQAPTTKVTTTSTTTMVEKSTVITKPTAKTTVAEKQTTSAAAINTQTVTTPTNSVEDAESSAGTTPSATNGQGLPGAVSGSGSSNALRSAAVDAGRVDPPPSRSSTVVLVSVVGVVCVGILLAAVWVHYAYHHPHSASGQMLIKYRPSNIFRRSTEPAYDVAVRL